MEAVKEVLAEVITPLEEPGYDIFASIKGLLQRGVGTVKDPASEDSQLEIEGEIN